MYHNRDSYGSDFGGGIAALGLLIMLLAAYATVVCIVFVVKTFMKYPEQRKKLWTALAVCVASCIGSGLLYKLTGFQGSGVLACGGIAVLLITCLVVEMKNRDTLLRENVSLMDEVLRKPWHWGDEDRPLQEQELEQLAA